MHRIAASLALLASLVLASGCYHATISTGKPASSTKIEKPWARGWAFGLIPPDTVETASSCPNGVSQVDTQLGLLNQIVGMLTIGIFTPMDIRVTCAR